MVRIRDCATVERKVTESTDHHRGGIQNGKFSVDRAANDAVDTRQNIVDRDGSATSGRDGDADTGTVSRDATTEEGELADGDLLAATVEAEAVHRRMRRGSEVVQDLRTRSWAWWSGGVERWGAERGVRNGWVSGRLAWRGRPLIVVAGQWRWRRWSWRSWRSWSNRRPR
jgi:hypothetical protein